MEQGRNRVFINPNFNKRVCNDIPPKNVAVMHVNPNFYQHSQNVQPQPKSKIYINPNFVRPNFVGPSNPQIQVINNTPHYVKPIPLMDSSNTLDSSSTSFSAPKRCVQSSIPTSSVSSEPYQTHSRYSLVRQKKPQEATNIVKPQTNTIKINKYKSIKITDIKKNLDSVKPVVKVTPVKESSSHKSLIKTFNNQKISKNPTNNFNRYKFVRTTAGSGKPQLKRQLSCTNKKVIYNRIKIKPVGVYKKNNIPCPQYRKYGKCLRKSHGKCEFLHDRKHVSICRKFLNGVCHNDNCLLSHELSDKKMPTCYFYLKGMCTKEGCPYLHVKLNEKAKICTDFVRGYCERGDKCLNSHIVKSLNIDKKRKLILKKISQEKILKYKLEKSKNKSVTNSTQKKKSKINSNHKSLQECDDAASRYYKDLIGESNNSESFDIKPTRCKLGTLPSFIQL